MAKKKEKEEKEKFDLSEALAVVNPFMLDGFKRFIADKKVASQKDFDKLLKEYGGD